MGGDSLDGEETTARLRWRVSYHLWEEVLMRWQSLTFLMALVGGLALLPAAQGQVVVADLAADYLGGSNGDTTADVWLVGTLSGSWNYYHDADGVVNDGSPVLLSFNATGVGGPSTNGDSGYEGTELLFGIPMPIVAGPAGEVYGAPHIAVPPPAGFLQTHPGTGASPYLAIEYLADSSLTGLTLEYELAIGSTVNFPDTEGDINYSIIQVLGGVASPLVASTNLRFEDSPLGTGALSIAVPDMQAGDSIWLLLDPNGLAYGDATNVRFTLTQVLEPATVALLGGMAVCGVVALRRRRK